MIKLKGIIMNLKTSMFIVTLFVTVLCNGQEAPIPQQNKFVSADAKITVKNGSPIQNEQATESLTKEKQCLPLLQNKVSPNADVLKTINQDLQHVCAGIQLQCDNKELKKIIISVTRKAGITDTEELAEKAYKMFNEQFTTLLWAFGAFLTIIGIGAPLLFYFLQMRSLNEERKQMQQEFKRKCKDFYSMVIKQKKQIDSATNQLKKSISENKKSLSKYKCQIAKESLSVHNKNLCALNGLSMIIPEVKDLHDIGECDFVSSMFTSIYIARDKIIGEIDGFTDHCTPQREYDSLIDCYNYCNSSLRESCKEVFPEFLGELTTIVDKKVKIYTKNSDETSSTSI